MYTPIPELFEFNQSQYLNQVKTHFTSAYNGWGDLFWTLASPIYRPFLHLAVALLLLPLNVLAVIALTEQEFKNIKETRLSYALKSFASSILNIPYNAVMIFISPFTDFARIFSRGIATAVNRIGKSVASRSEPEMEYGYQEDVHDNESSKVNEFENPGHHSGLFKSQQNESSKPEYYSSNSYNK